MAWWIWNNKNLSCVGGKKGHALIKEVAEKVIEYVQKFMETNVR